MKGAFAGRELPSGPSENTPKTNKREPERRIIVRRERRGRGGKAVTIVAGLTRAELGQWPSEIGKSLGTGVRAEGDQLVVQGELGQRLVLWLEARGLRHILLAN